MAFYLSPIGNEAQIDSNGDPLVGGQIFTYAAGTSSNLATYKTDAGTAQANPIVLNALGLPDDPIWLEGGSSYKFVIKDADDNLIRTIDDITGVNDPDVSGAVTEWITYTASPTYIGATSFSVAGDQTGTFQVGRRLRSENTGGTTFSSISASSYNAGTTLTTVTVTNDSGSLDSGLSSVAYGILSVTNPSFPRASAADAAAGTSDNVILTPSSLKSGQIILGTATATTSGTTHDRTGIPSWAKRVTVMLRGVSTGAGSSFLVRLGDAGGFEATGYTGAIIAITDGPTAVYAASTVGWTIGTTGATGDTLDATMILNKITGNYWSITGTSWRDGSTDIGFSVSGSKQLSDTLTQVRLTTAAGDTFDAGEWNVSWE